MDDIIRPEEMVKALKKVEQEDLMWEGIQDAFKSVHDLYDGDKSLLSKEDYLYFNDVDASVKVKISILKTEGAWIFLAIRGSKLFSPRWFLIDSDDTIYSELPDVCRKLRQKLTEEYKTAQRG